MYRIRTHDQAKPAISALPDTAAGDYAEALGLLKLFPWESGQPWDENNPDGNIRTLPFGRGGFVTYLILDRDAEVHIIEVFWAG